MDNLITDDLKQQYHALPPELQEAISSADLPRKFEAIEKDNKLMIDQAGGVQMETLLVLLGLQPLDSYIDNLAKNAALTKDQANAVANDANELIFKNIRDSLKKINEEAAMVDTSGNLATKGVWQPTNQPAKEKIIPTPEKPVEAKIENESDSLPEIYPEPTFPVKSILTKQEPYHENISPVENIVKSKMTETVIVPKEKIIIEEKTKLPDLPAQTGKAKPSDSTDPYREPVI